MQCAANWFCSIFCASSLFVIVIEISKQNVIPSKITAAVSCPHSICTEAKGLKFSVTMNRCELHLHYTAGVWNIEGCQTQRYHIYMLPKWQPTPVFLPGKSHGCRSLQRVGATKSRTWLSDFTSKSELFSACSSYMIRRENGRSLKYKA